MLGVSLNPPCTCRLVAGAALGALFLAWAAVAHPEDFLRGGSDAGLRLHGGPDGTHPSEESAGEVARDQVPRDWYIFAATVNVYPRLESERVVKKFLEPALRGLAPGHPGLNTISDLRDDHLLWPPHFGVGCNLNDRWAVFVEAGYTVVKVRTRSSDRSIFLLPLHTDFEIKRTGVFGGAGVDYFPWGMAAQEDYKGLWTRLAAARPFVGTRLTWTYTTFRAKTKLGFAPLPNFVNVELSDGWHLPSATVVAGFDLPLSERTALTASVGHNHFWDQEFDLEGWAFTVQLKYFFRGPGAG